MARIPFQLRTQTVPGSSIPTGRATPNTFGAQSAVALQQGAAQVSAFAADYVNKKAKEDADMYVSKASSAAKAHFTQRAIDLRKTTNGDISALMDQEMADYKKLELPNAPNDEATTRMTMSFDSMFGTFKANSIINDESERVTRILFTDEQAYQDDRSTAYNASDPGAGLATLTAGMEAKVNGLDISEQAKVELIEKRKFQLGFDSIQGMVDRDETGARQALAMLQDPSDPTDAFVNKADKAKLMKYADETISAHEADEARKLRVDSANRAIVQRDERNTLFQALLEDTLTPDMIKDSGADADTKSFIRNAMINESTRDTLPPKIERVEKYMDLVELIEDSHQDDYFATETEIMAAYDSRLIDKAEYKDLMKRLDLPEDQARKTFEKSLDTIINRTDPITGTKDPKGAELFTNAMTVLTDLVFEAEQNKVPMHELFDFRSEHYVMPKLQQFIRTEEQIFNDIFKVNQPPAAQTTEEDQSIVDSIIEAIQ